MGHFSHILEQDHEFIILALLGQEFDDRLSHKNLFYVIARSNTLVIQPYEVDFVRMALMNLVIHMSLRRPFLEVATEKAWRMVYANV